MFLKGEFISAEALEYYYLKSENFQSLNARLKMIHPDEEDGYSGETSNPLRKVATTANPMMQKGTNGDMLDDSVDTTTLESTSAAAVKKPYPIQVLAVVSLYETVTKLPSLEDLQAFWFKSGIIFRRAAHSIIVRPSLIVGNVLLHVILALAFAWVLETPSFNTMIAYYGIGSMFLIMANIQLIFFIYNNQKLRTALSEYIDNIACDPCPAAQVFLKEHGRGLYSNFTHFNSASLPLYLLGAVNGVVFSSTSYGIFTRDGKVDSSSGNSSELRDQVVAALIT